MWPAWISEINPGYSGRERIASQRYSVGGVILPECDISSRDFSVSRFFLNFLRASVSVSKILVSKKSLGIGLDEIFWSRHSVHVSKDFPRAVFDKDRVMKIAFPEDLNQSMA